MLIAYIAHCRTVAAREYTSQMQLWAAQVPLYKKPPKPPKMPPILKDPHVDA